MTDELAYKQEAATEYGRVYSHVSAHLVSFLLRAARLAPGQRVLDVATGDCHWPSCWRRAARPTSCGASPRPFCSR